MKFLKPPTELTYIEVPISSSSAPIDVLGSRKGAATVVLGVFPTDEASVLFGDADVSLGVSMALTGTEAYAVSPVSRFMILENRSGAVPLRVSYYVY